MSIIDNVRSISVLIPDGDGSFDIIKVLRCLGQDSRIVVHVLSSIKLPITRFSRYCKYLHHNSSRNNDEWIEIIESVVKRYNIDVVLPVTIKGTQLISKNREEILKFSKIPPIPEYRKIELARNKWSLYQLAIQNELPVVPSIFIDKAGEQISGSAELDSIEYPALLKPTLQRGGSGFVKIDSPCDLQNAWKDERIIKGSEYILQSYIPGYDVSFSVFCESGNVKAYTLWKELLASKEPYHVPRLIEYTEDEQAVDIGRRLVSAIGWDGVADIDLFFDTRDKTIKILEINPRYWQSILGSLMAGVNFPLMACLTAMGEECPQMKQTRQIKYSRQSNYFNMLMGFLLRKKMAKGFSIADTTLRFILKDPLPELVYTFRKVIR